MRTSAPRISPATRRRAAWRCMGTAHGRALCTAWRWVGGRVHEGGWPCKCAEGWAEWRGFRCGTAGVHARVFLLLLAGKCVLECSVVRPDLGVQGACGLCAEAELCTHRQRAWTCDCTRMRAHTRLCMVVPHTKTLAYGHVSACAQACAYACLLTSACVCARVYVLCRTWRR